MAGARIAAGVGDMLEGPTVPGVIGDGGTLPGVILAGTPKLSL